MLATFAASLEYYDFILYAMLAPILSQLFFPADDPHFNTIKVYLLFALGYLVRPIGGILFGLIGDSIGRKSALVASITLMAASTACIAVLPTYEQIGISASIALLLLRLCQGLSFGAELPGTLTILSEITCDRDLGFKIGCIFSVLCLISCFSFLIQWALLTGWGLPSPIACRLAFGLGGIIAIVAYLIRRDLPETKSHQASRPAIQILALLFQQQLSRVLTGFMISFIAASTIVPYLWLPHYYTNRLAVPLEQAYLTLAIGYFASFILLPGFGILTGRYGSMIMFKSGCLLMAIVLTLGQTLSDQHHFNALIVFAVCYQIAVALLSASYPYYLARLFPSELRFTGIALCYNTAFAMASLMPSILSFILINNKPKLLLNTSHIATILLIIVILLILRNKSAGT